MTQFENHAQLPDNDAPLPAIANGARPLEISKAVAQEGVVDLRSATLPAPPSADCAPDICASTNKNNQPDNDRRHAPTRPDLFAKYSESWVLFGSQDVASFLYYGGLSSTGYSWRDFSMKVYERSGFHSEVYSLAGDDGDWGHFKGTSHREWVDDIVTRARKLDNPIFFGYSTSALAGLVAAAENPGLFKGIVLAAPPLRLHSYKHRTALAVAEYLYSHYPKRFGWIADICVSMGPRDFEYQTKTMRKGPHFASIPAPTVFALKRLQREAWKALDKIDVPVLIVQGEHDRVVSGKGAELLLSRIASTNKECRFYAHSNHSLLLGADKNQILRDVCSWLNEECLPTMAESEKIPDMKTRLTKKAAVEMVMGAMWDRFRKVEEAKQRGDQDQKKSQ